MQTPKPLDAGSTKKLIDNSVAAETDYPFECSLLADPETINAFARWPRLYYRRTVQPAPNRRPVGWRNGA